MNPVNAKLIYTKDRVWKNPANDSFPFSGDILDVYIFEQDVSIDNIVFQEDETCDAKFATSDEIIKLIKSGEFISTHHFPYLDQ